MCIFSGPYKLRGCVCKPLPLLRCVDLIINLDRIGDVCTPDVLAFSLIVFRARKSRVQGLNFPTILDTIAEDSMRYFMVIFSAHFVLVMTLNLGRVSVTVSQLSGLQLMTPTARASRKRSNLFQPRKSRVSAPS